MPTNPEIEPNPNQEPNSALVVAKPVTAVGSALPSDQIKPPITAAQAKVEAVATLTMQAYQKAATLQITPEESAALLADFPDEAFQPGAAGKENLIYIEHAHLRDRFTQVFGMGQWAIIPRNRWSESFRTFKGTEGERVYVEAMLVIRGCFVGEAVGAMEYYPKNESQNYGDAVEGAKTAAFRRCAKEFGVGLQAWKREFCDGWWQRKRLGNRTPRAATTPATPSPEPAKPAPKPEAPKFATEETRLWMIKNLGASPGSEARPLVTEYFQKIGRILPNEQLEDLPLKFVPISKAELHQIAAKIAEFESGQEATEALPPHDEPEEPKSKPAAQSKPVEVPRDKPEPEQDAWRTFPMPFGKNAGVPLEDLEKNYLFGLAMNYEVELEFNGKPKRQETIAKDTMFRKMLDQAMLHYNWMKKETV